MIRVVALVILAFVLLPYDIYSKNDKIEVRGTLIDIRELSPREYVYPQNRSYRFPKEIPVDLSGKKYAVSLMEFSGATHVRSNSRGEITVALHYGGYQDGLWRETGQRIVINDTLTYYVYTIKYDKPNEWIAVPSPKSGGNSSLVIGDDIEVVGCAEPPGTLLAKVYELRKTNVTNPAIAILPDGSYVAACSGVFVEPGKKNGPSYFLSTNKGKSWKVVSKLNKSLNFYNLFYYGDALYTIGIKSSKGGLAIAKSYDRGRTWTVPVNEDNGLLSKLYNHSAPVPVVFSKGRIWRAVEYLDPSGGDRYGKQVAMMSAPINSDWLKASSWTFTNLLQRDVNWISGGMKSFKQWIEGNAVVAPDGNVVNLLRVDEWYRGGYAAIVHVDSPERISFNPQNDIIRMPGGGKKFTVRYDAESGKYWALTNPEFEQDFMRKHRGIYKDGVNSNFIRNNLALIYSEDLITWHIKDIIIQSDNPFFDGFQYADWQIDGKDMVAVIRLAMEESRGLPEKQHDANMLSFIKIPNFRTESFKTIQIRTLSE